jgi:hypothetical protein
LIERDSLNGLAAPHADREWQDPHAIFSSSFLLSDAYPFELYSPYPRDDRAFLPLRVLAAFPMPEAESATKLLNQSCFPAIFELRNITPASSRW